MQRPELPTRIEPRTGRKTSPMELCNSVRRREAALAKLLVICRVRMMLLPVSAFNGNYPVYTLSTRSCLAPVPEYVWPSIDIELDAQACRPDFAEAGRAGIARCTTAHPRRKSHNELSKAARCGLSSSELATEIFTYLCACMLIHLPFLATYGSSEYGVV